MEVEEQILLTILKMNRKNGEGKIHAILTYDGVGRLTSIELKDINNTELVYISLPVCLNNLTNNVTMVGKLLKSQEKDLLVIEVKRPKRKKSKVC